MVNGKEAHPRRVLLKLSGEAFGGGSVGIDTTVIRRIAGEIKEARDKGNQIAVVVGGGNFFRGAELSQAGLERARADYMGMLGTVMNCLALQDSWSRKGRHPGADGHRHGAGGRGLHPLAGHQASGEGEGRHLRRRAGMPYFSTDTVSIQRALEIGCDEVLMGKNGVDGVYSADPRKDPTATMFTTLSYKKALVDNLAVMDASALSMARDNKMPIRVFGLETPGNITKVINGEPLGTLVTDHD